MAPNKRLNLGDIVCEQPQGLNTLLRYQSMEVIQSLAATFVSDVVYKRLNKIIRDKSILIGVLVMTGEDEKDCFHL